EPENVGKQAIAKSNRISRNGIEYRLDIGRRAADHPQDLTRRRLLLQCFSKLTVASIELVKQPHVLDGDDRLIGATLKLRDLLFRKGANFSTAEMNHAKSDAFSQQRNG